MKKEFFVCNAKQAPKTSNGNKAGIVLGVYFVSNGDTLAVNGDRLCLETIWAIR